MRIKTVNIMDQKAGEALQRQSKKCKNMDLYEHKDGFAQEVPINIKITFPLP